MAFGSTRHELQIKPRTKFNTSLRAMTKKNFLNKDAKKAELRFSFDDEGCVKIDSKRRFIPYESFA